MAWSHAALAGHYDTTDEGERSNRWHHVSRLLLLVCAYMYVRELLTVGGIWVLDVPGEAAATSECKAENSGAVHQSWISR